jgi:hypothetical protein
MVVQNFTVLKLEQVDARFSRCCRDYAGKHTRALGCVRPHHAPLGRIPLGGAVRERASGPR